MSMVVIIIIDLICDFIMRSQENHKIKGRYRIIDVIVPGEYS